MHRQAGTAMTSTSRPLLAALAAVATVAALTACTGSDQPQPSPTPSVVATTTPPPSPTPTLSEQDQNIADAKTAYLAFVAAYDLAAQGGFSDVNLSAAVLGMTSGDARVALVSSQQAFQENGLHQTGNTVVKSLEATEYEEDTTGSGMHAVGLRACLDLSNSDTVYADGSSTTPTDQPQYRGPRNVYVGLLRQESGWVVRSVEPRPEERC